VTVQFFFSGIRVIVTAKVTEILFSCAFSSAESALAMTSLIGRGLGPGPGRDEGGDLGALQWYCPFPVRGPRNYGLWYFQLRGVLIHSPLPVRGIGCEE
jgi:hypothetical protein